MKVLRGGGSVGLGVLEEDAGDVAVSGGSLLETGFLHDSEEVHRVVARAEASMASKSSSSWKRTLVMDDDGDIQTREAREQIQRIERGGVVRMLKKVLERPPVIPLDSPEKDDVHAKDVVGVEKGNIEEHSPDVEDVVTGTGNHADEDDFKFEEVNQFPLLP